MSESDDMKGRSELPREILEAFEVCDLGRDGDCDDFDSMANQLAAFLADQPEWAELHARLEQLDEVLRHVIRDVPVPEGLEQRLLGRLQAIDASQAFDAGQADDMANEVKGLIDGGDNDTRSTSIATCENARRRRRRRLLLGSAAVVAASALVVGMLFSWLPGAWTTSQVCDEALRRFVPANELGVEPLSEDVLRRFPVAPDVAIRPGTQWRKIDDFLGREAVAYEMSGWRGNRATLFVVSCPRTISNVAQRAPRRSTSVTGGRVVGVWQTAGMVYVLVVDGNDRDYNGFLRPRPALT